MRPLIGIPAYTGTNPLAGQDTDTAYLPIVYGQAIRRAGGRVVVLPPGGDDEEAAHTILGLDGLMLAGGPDINPHLYGAETHPQTQASDVVRDAWETKLVIHALMHRVPFLGICRGMQMLNVRLGGTLHQDLKHADSHGSDVPGFGTHYVSVAPGSFLETILPVAGRQPLLVPTRHHQGVDTPGRGLRVAARHRDGTVEAVEMTGQRFVVGVQWHPERGNDPRLFNAFIKAAGGG